jgi:hypothetical protein
MAVKLYEVHSDVFKALGDDYLKLGKSDLIKLDLFAKLLIEGDVSFKFVKEGSSTYLELTSVEIPSKILTTISKLRYTLSNRRIKIL